MHRARSRATAFSLIELLIILTIVSILAVFAYPSYTDYQRKARRLDAKTALQEVATSQEQFYVTNRRYTADLRQLGLSNLSADGHYVINVAAADGQSFTAVAAPAPGSPQTADDDCQQFSLDNESVKVALPDTAGKCW